MGQKKIKKIIVKFLNKEANKDELTILDLWLRNEKNQILFNKYAKIEYLISSSMDVFDIEKAKHEIKKKRRVNIRKKRIITFSKYVAAVFIIGLVVSPFIFNNNKNEISPITNQESISQGTNKAILTLNNGSEIYLDKNHTYNSNKIKSDGASIVYKKDTSSNTIAYNYLTTPTGGQHKVQLSDGTQIWLNSESKLKFPESFIKGETRVVELIYGEAYLEVSSSKLHNGTKFIVKSKIQDIEVLGTKFNIKAYENEGFTYTTLTEGSIKVSNQSNSKILTPHHQSVISNTTSEILISKANVSEAIAWKNGVFSFKNMKLRDIMKTLSRWYGTQTIFENPEIQDIKFTGVLGKDQNIIEILTIITNLNGIDYEIKNNTIIFK